jgi:hypothetical protein
VIVRTRRRTKQRTATISPQCLRRAVVLADDGDPAATWATVSSHGVDRRSTPPPRPSPRAFEPTKGQAAMLPASDEQRRRGSERILE